MLLVNVEYLALSVFSRKSLNIALQESFMKVIPNCVVNESFLILRLSSSLIFKNYVFIPPKIRIYNVGKDNALN